MATFLAMSPWTDLFLTSVGGGPPLPVLAAEVTVALVIAVASIVLARWRFAASVGASVAGFLLFSLFAVVEPRFSVSGFVDGYTGAIDRILTSVPPLLVSGGALVPLATLGWLVVAANAELVLRTKSVGLLLIGPVGLLLISQLVATRPSVAEAGLASQLWLPLTVLACLALMVVFRHQSLDMGRIGEPSAPERRAMLVAPFVGVLLVLFTVAVAVGVTDLVPGVSKEASLERQPPVEQTSSGGPVETFAALRNSESRFSQSFPCEDGDGDGDGCVLLRVEGLPPGRQYIGLVALTDYDGSTWQLPDESDESLFVPVGLEIPGDVAPGRPTIDQTFTVVQSFPPDQLWLAAVTQPTEVLELVIEGAVAQGVLVNPNLGAIRSPVPLTDGDRYRVLSAQSRQSFDLIGANESVLGRIPPPPQSARRQLSGAVSATTRQWLSALGLDSSNPFPNVGAIQSLAEVLASGGVDTATEGEVTKGSRSLSLAGLDGTFPLNEERVASPTPEQVASHMALLVRSAGLPSRVVVGFRVESPDGEVATLGTEDQWTWAEVFIGDYGWVAVDPEAGGEPPPTTQAAGGGDEVASSTSLLQRAPTIAPSPLPSPERSSPVGATVAVAAVVVAVGLLALVLGHRRRRWTRRRRGAPVESVLGAWHELLDRLDESRTGPLRASTGPEVVAAVRDRHGDEVAQPVGNVAMLADPAVFSARPMTSEEAEAAWRNLEAARRALTTRLTLGQRLVGFLRSYRPRRFRRT